ncbi:MAG: ribosomal protein [Pseudomonadota bacterium]|jgi:small subunit ribosomal protein S16
MSVKIRLTRAGAKKAPFYHVIATDSRTKRDGAYLENLGSYDPRVTPAVIKLNDERIGYWLGVGAQPSETVASILKKAKAAA